MAPKPAKFIRREGRTEKIGEHVDDWRNSSDSIIARRVKLSRNFAKFVAINTIPFTSCSNCHPIVPNGPHIATGCKVCISQGEVSNHGLSALGGRGTSAIVRNPFSSSFVADARLDSRLDRSKYLKR
jgi:hypothetical protein